MSKPKKRLLVPVNKASFELGYQAGRTEGRLENETTVKVVVKMARLSSWLAVELVAIQTLAIATTDDNLLHEQLTSRRKVIEGLLGDVDVFNRSLPDDARPIDTTWAMNIRDALADIQAYKMTVDEFRQIVSEAPAYDELIQIRSDYVGTPDKRQPATRYLDSMLEEVEADLKRTMTRRVTSSAIGKEMIRRLQALPARSNIEEAALEILLESRQKGSRTLSDYVRQRKRRLKKRVSKKV